MKTRTLLRCCLALGASFICQMAFAVNFGVNSTADDHDALLGDHRCATSGNVCTLRAALEEADVDHGAVKIGFNLPDPSVIVLAHGQLEIGPRRSPLRIEGPGANLLAVDGNHESRVLFVDVDSTVLLSGMTLRNGLLNPDETDLGAGIRSLGTLTLDNVVVADNQNNGGSGGGGIASSGRLLLLNSFVENNIATDSGGGIENSGVLTLVRSVVTGNENLNDGWGGGIANAGTAVLHGSTISGNYSGFLGGGIRNAGDLSVSDSTLSGNEGSRGGGGLYNTGMAVLRNVTVSGNLDTDHGAGIGNGAGTLILVNSTISNNHSQDSVGGIWNKGALSLINTTISNNSCEAQTGGLINLPGGTVAFRNSIVAGNHADYTEDREDCSILPGSIISRSYDLFGTGTGCPPGDTDILIDPQEVSDILGPLQDNGGPTWTMALLEGAPGNPAIDGGNPEGCQDELDHPLTIDQRHQPRPSPRRGRCDIGAFEHQRPRHRHWAEAQGDPVVIKTGD